MSTFHPAGSHLDERGDARIVRIDGSTRPGCHSGLHRFVAAAGNHALCCADATQFEVAVFEPVPAVAAMFGRSSSSGVLLVRHSACCEVGFDHVIPHSQCQENMRAHMKRVRGTGGDLRQRTRGHERSGGVLRVVHGMNPVVGRAGMVGVPDEDGFRDRRGLQVSGNVAHALAFAQQRQGIEELRFVVFRPGVGQLAHRLGVAGVAFGLAAGAAVENLNGAEPGAFAWIGNALGAGFRCGCKFGQSCLASLDVQFIPDRMIEGHRLSPVGHDKTGVRFFRGDERTGGIVVFKKMQQEQAAHEFACSGRRVR
jgi:hypothetical protein